MSTTVTISGHSPAPLSSVRAWLSTLCAAYLMPLLSLIFLLTGPHRWWVSLLFILPVWGLTLVDLASPLEQRALAPGAAKWPFNLHLYALAGLQLTNHVLLGVMVARLQLWPAAQLGSALADLLAMHFVCFVAAAYSGIIVAHELVHRKNPFEYHLGRLLLAFVCYEHFATEHVRGHHRRVGTPQDPATARFGETFTQYFLRTVPAQFRSAWKLENNRVGAGSRWYSPAMLRHRVLQGVLCEAVILGAFWLVFGWLALIAFVLQARMAITLLELVNYIEHWGITRRGRRVTNEDSWDTDSAFTLYTLLALSRHAHHHTSYGSPYQELRSVAASPKLPFGYLGTVTLAGLRNKRFRELATAELAAKRLGPFRAAANPGAQIQ